MCSYYYLSVHGVIPGESTDYYHSYRRPTEESGEGEYFG